jgi:protein O-GlcNAc transferase
MNSNTEASEDPLARAQERYSAGDPAAAVAICRQALATRPRDFDLTFILALALLQLGPLGEAAHAFELAHELRPSNAEVLNNWGVALLQLGRADEARVRLKSAVTLAPNFFEAHVNLGNTHMSRGDASAAVATYNDALLLRRDSPELFNNFGTALHAMGRIDEAAASFEAALILRDGYVEARRNLARMLTASGRLAEALPAWQRLCEHVPNSSEAHAGLGLALAALGRKSEAVQSLERATAAAPDDVAILMQLGGLLFSLGRVREALTHNARATTLSPGTPELHNNLGNCHYLLGEHAAAIASYRTALALRPGLPNAISLYYQAKRQICDWSNFADDEATLLAHLDNGTADIDPFTALWTTDDPGRQLRAAKRQVAKHQAASPWQPLAGQPPRRLTIGYLSPDFHEHPVGLLVAELLERHDRNAFRVAAFSVGSGSGGGETRTRIMRSVDTFVDASSMTDAELAEKIRQQRIDILVHLAGHTYGNRLGVLALRPAPVQVEYLGYSGTTGATFVDWMIADDFVVPENARQHYTERLCNIPGCYFLNHDRRNEAALVPSRKTCGLPANGFVFCCFNSLYKITPDVFAAWMRLLHAIPGSVLWLKGDRTIARTNLMIEAQTQGIDSARLVFAGNVDLPVHLARHQNADLFLDTFPYNAASTAADALWMGLPVLTRSGATFVSRVAGSMLREIGHSELIAESPSAYEQKALAFARNPLVLAEIRSNLRAKRGTVRFFDPDSYRLHLEAAYRFMWSRAQEQRPS